MSMTRLNSQSHSPSNRRAACAYSARVLDVLVPEVVLNQPQVRHLAQVGKVIAARVAQHVWPHVAELGTVPASRMM